MADTKPSKLPLLPLPVPTRAPESKRSKRLPELHIPTRERQIERLEPQIDRLQKAIEARTLEIREDPQGSEPELTIVLETRGPVKYFLGAVRRTPGLKWLAEFEQEGVAADEEFFEQDNPEKELRGFLYLLMTNRRAVDRLLSLWAAFKKDKPFSHGHGAWKSLFELLYEVRLWDAIDRVRETGLLEDWQDRLEMGAQSVHAEVELWFPRNVALRSRNRRAIEQKVLDLGGAVVGTSEISAIHYHALLVEIPAREAMRVIEDLSAVELIRADEVMFFRPVGQVAVDLPPVETDNPSDPERPKMEATGDPAVALLDGVPFGGHERVSGRLILDDPDAWSEEVPVAERRHGTAMASLILHGDLSAPSDPLRSPIYVRPILKSSDIGLGERVERIPQTLLPIDLVYRSVRRLFRGQNGEGGVAPTVQIINFSVGDPARPFAHGMSPWARLLDWLSIKYNVLFVVSAGNHYGPIELDLPSKSMRDLDAGDLRQRTLEAVYGQSRLRRLLSPAEAINGLCIGAEHADASDLPSEQGGFLDPIVDSTGTRLPSPVGACGPGFSRAPKPDIFLPGGRQVYRTRLGGTDGRLILDPVRSVGPPGLRCAAPGRGIGEVARTHFLCGTSNAAALATHVAASIYEDFEERVDLLGELELPYRSYWPALLKAFLVHYATWGNTGEVLEPLARKLANSPQMFRQRLGQFLGYGFLDREKVLNCTDHRVTLLRWGSLGFRSEESAHRYELPLPPSLSGLRGRRRLVITLAWMTPIKPERSAYRGVQLWFDVPGVKERLGVESSESDRNTTGRGTVQHEVFEGVSSVSFSEGESLTIQVNCREDAGVPSGESGVVSYGLVVSLDTAPSLKAKVYEDVRSALRTRIRQPIRP